MTELMTKGEIKDIGILVRKQEKALKAKADERGAELRADFERQMAAIYHWDDDDVWAEASEAARKAVDEAKTKIAARCQELGIPARLAPSVDFHWYGRGENAVTSRRSELRHVARAEIDAITKQAKTRIENWSLETQTDLIRHGLSSDAANNFLENMPTTDDLMPKIDFQRVEQITKRKPDWE